MDFDTILQWLKLGTEHQYLALAVAVIGWLTALTSDWSKFPITVPGRWQPAIVAGLGVVYAVLLTVKGGESWLPALEGGLVAAVTSGFLYDLVVKGLWNGKIPSWLAWLAWAQDHRNAPAVKAIRKQPPPSGPSVMVLVLVAALASREVACKPAAAPSAADYQCLVDDVLVLGVKDPAQIAKDCPGFASVAVEDLLAWVEGMLNAKTEMQQKGLLVAPKAGAK